jgi:Alginate export
MYDSDRGATVISQLAVKRVSGTKCSAINNWGLSPPKNNGYLLQRLTAYSDFHVNGRVRFFMQPMSAIEAGRKGGPRPVIDESTLFFEQAFVDITVAAEKENSLVMRLGRQEFYFGSGRLVDPREGPNVRLAGMESLSFGKRPHGTSPAHTGTRRRSSSKKFSRTVTLSVDFCSCSDVPPGYRRSAKRLPSGARS